MFDGKEMNSDNNDGSSHWRHTRRSLRDVMEILRCHLCKSWVDVEYVTLCCKDLVCSKCFKETKICSRCPSKLTVGNGPDVKAAFELCKRLSKLLHFNVLLESALDDEDQSPETRNSRESDTRNLDVNLNNQDQTRNLNSVREYCNLEEYSNRGEDISSGQAPSVSSRRVLDTLQPISGASNLDNNAAEHGNIPEQLNPGLPSSAGQVFRGYSIVTVARVSESGSSGGRNTSGGGKVVRPVGLVRKKNQSSSIYTSTLENDELEMVEDGKHSTRNHKPAVPLDISYFQPPPTNRVEDSWNSGKLMSPDTERKTIAANSLLKLASSEVPLECGGRQFIDIQTVGKDLSTPTNVLTTTTTTIFNEIRDQQNQIPTTATNVDNIFVNTPLQLTSSKANSSAFLTPTSESKKYRKRIVMESFASPLEGRDEGTKRSVRSRNRKDKLNTTLPLDSYFKKSSKNYKDVGPESETLSKKPSQKRFRTESMEGSDDRDERGLEKKRQIKNNSISKNNENICKIYKRNKKGETELHIACIKGDLELVEKLLREGFEPDVKDNANWTPLHEACNRGHANVVELLLNYGACIDPCASENCTPLHDAVQNNRLECVKVLLARGADVNKRNTQGQIALFLAYHPDIVELLKSHDGSTTNGNASNRVVRVMQPVQPVSIVITTTGLNKDAKNWISATICKLNWTLENDFNEQVTHVITSTSEKRLCQRTLKYMQAVLLGKWIVTIDWLKECDKEDGWVSEDDFEVPGCNNHPHDGIPKKGRTNSIVQVPGFFNGCNIFISNSISSSSQLRRDLTSLIKHGSGHLLVREPKIGDLDVEAIDLNVSLNASAINKSLNSNFLTAGLSASVPHHAHAGSPFANCSYFVVYPELEGGISYQFVNKRLCKVTPSWIFDCISSYTLIE